MLVLIDIIVEAVKISKQKLRSFKKKASSPEACFGAFAVFLAITFFTGGGSRDDIQSLLLLRPLAFLFCAYALTTRISDQWSGRIFPLVAASALVVLMALQLIPLPPSMWTEMPGRQIFADIADVAGIEQPWRPLTLSPSKTLNSLFSMAVPIAAILLYLNLDDRHRKLALPVIIVLCTISALWAIFQIVGPARGPLYIYRITNFGTGVGLFANRNHQAVMLASAIVMLGWYAGSLRPRSKQAALRFYGSMAVILIFVPLIFVTGSRAGLLLMVPALVIALFFIYFGEYHTERPQRRTSKRGKKIRFFSGRQVILVVSITVIVGIAASSILLSRSLAFDRLLIGNDVEELRWKLLPIFFTMLNDYLPWGSGFGSFEHIYKIYEPQELLSPSYLNQAHNDWLQLPIEGGVPVLLIAICASVWWIMRLHVLLKNWRGSGRAKHTALMCIAIILILLVASVGDYPLRVPSIMAVFAVLICTFNDSIRSVQQRAMKLG